MKEKELTDEYASFARAFPSLVHSCGLAQAVAFALAREHAGPYLQDLAKILTQVEEKVARSPETLAEITREQPVPAYTL
jgi:CRISPR/Cas system CMR-associated protein Cmr5 small subunit